MPEYNQLIINELKLQCHIVCIENGRALFDFSYFLRGIFFYEKRKLP